MAWFKLQGVWGRVTKELKKGDVAMKRNSIFVLLLIVTFVALQIVPPAHAEPITLTIMAIAGITAVVTTAFTDMATHPEHMAQAKSQKAKPHAEVYAKDRPADSAKDHDARAATVR
jgi:hypothetical protein